MERERSGCQVSCHPLISRGTILTLIVKSPLLRCSFTFGSDVVSRFLAKHDMDLICRAHQVVEDGYEFFAKRQLVTLFSAPNYCGEFDNAGAMMSVDDTLLCSFQVSRNASKARESPHSDTGRPMQILKPAEKRAPKYGIGGVTPPRKQKKKDGKTS